MSISKSFVKKKPRKKSVAIVSNHKKSKIKRDKDAKITKKQRKAIWDDVMEPSRNITPNNSRESTWKDTITRSSTFDPSIQSSKTFIDIKIIDFPISSPYSNVSSPISEDSNEDGSQGTSIDETLIKPGNNIDDIIENLNQRRSVSAIDNMIMNDINGLRNKRKRYNSHDEYGSKKGTYMESLISPSKAKKVSVQNAIDRALSATTDFTEDERKDKIKANKDKSKRLRNSDTLVSQNTMSREISWSKKGSTFRNKYDKVKEKERAFMALCDELLYTCIDPDKVFDELINICNILKKDPNGIHELSKNSVVYVYPNIRIEAFLMLIGYQLKNAESKWIYNVNNHKRNERDNLWIALKTLAESQTRVRERQSTVSIVNMRRQTISKTYSNHITPYFGPKKVVLSGNSTNYKVQMQRSAPIQLSPLHSTGSPSNSLIPSKVKRKSKQLQTNELSALELDDTIAFIIKDDVKDQNEASITQYNENENKDDNVRNDDSKATVIGDTSDNNTVNNNANTVNIDTKDTGNNDDTKLDVSQANSSNNLTVDTEFKIESSRTYFELSETIVLSENVFLDELIWSITHPSNRDLLAKNVLLLCYPTIVSKEELLNAFEKRLFDDDATWDIRVKVINVLKLWLKLYYMEDFYQQENMINQMENIVTKIDNTYTENDTKYTKLTEMITKTLIHEQKQISSRLQKRTLTSRYNCQTTTPKSQNPKEAFDRFIKMDNRIIAQQITVMDANIFMLIEPRECIQTKWKFTNPNRKKEAKHLVKIIDQFNKTCKWVQSCILLAPSVKKRAKVIKKFILICHELLILRNFQSLKAIHSALESNAIFKLKDAWNYIANKSLKVWDTIKLTMKQDKNMFNLRKLQRESKLPMIPYIGVLTQDLVGIDEGHKKIKVMVSKKSNSENVNTRGFNWNKLIRLYDAVNQCLDYQKDTYHFKENIIYQQYIITEMNAAKNIDSNFIFMASTDVIKKDKNKVKNTLIKGKV